MLFPKDDFAVHALTVATSAGAREVEYRAYRHLPYVADPIDPEYQSLDVDVPVEVDGVAVDATDAPILLINGVGGYMADRNTADAGIPPLREGVVGARQRELALAAGYVVVWPGCRGRDNQAADGTYYGKAPAAIVDLKAAVRYVRHNRGALPGNVERIVSTGCSAGGALSALLGASGNSPLYDTYLEEIGAADEPDDIYASACYSPVLDLEHADMAYEWMWGASPVTLAGKPVDQALSARLRGMFAEYQASLGLQGGDGFGLVTAQNYDRYLMEHYLVPSANRYIEALTDDARAGYLASHGWIAWDGENAHFTFANYQAYAGRFKNCPAFDDVDMKAHEPSLFGSKTVAARHFTDLSLRLALGDENAEVERDVKALVDLMNPMYFILRDNDGCAGHWWLRRGTNETGISHTSLTNLDLGLRNRGKDVDSWMFWDARHCVDEDPEGFIAWVGDITGS
jgi:hypothetical protein